MKSMIMITALFALSPAVAQPTGQDDPAPRPGTYVARPSGNTVDSYDAASGTHGVTQQGTVPDGRSSGATTDHPPCSETITDGCVQMYERGRAPD